MTAGPGVGAQLAIDGPAAPPRDNGELVFVEPWESRAFGMAMSLHDAGAFTWEQFQAALIVRIKAWEDGHPPDERYSYYACWLGALEDVLAGDGTVFADEISARAGELAARPSGHDHAREDHDHVAHGHGH